MKKDKPCPSCNDKGYVTKDQKGEPVYHPKSCPDCKGSGKAKDANRN